MTRADKWKKRDCVLRYRDFADEARAACGLASKLDKAPLRLDFIAYLPMPASWSKRKRGEMQGEPHRQKPDLDNCCKSIFDSLFHDDSKIADSLSSKRWDDGAGPRIIVTLYW